MVINNIWRKRYPEKYKAYLERTKDTRKIKMREYRFSRYKPCPDCGKLITHTAKRCHSCALRLGIKNNIHWAIPKGSSREKSFSWKGGRTISRGYIDIFKPEHPRAKKNGYVSEHILIWGIANNKILPKGWVIHHLNGIRSDNRLENLAALSCRKHSQVIGVLKKRIQELEGMLKQQAQLL